MFIRGLEVDDFFPRPPRGGRQRRLLPRLQPRRNFYPRPPRGGRHNYRHLILAAQNISIHALREEGDLGTVDDADFLKVFLSTPSARRATFMTLA